MYGPDLLSKSNTQIFQYSETRTSVSPQRETGTSCLDDHMCCTDLDFCLEVLLLLLMLMLVNRNPVFHSMSGLLLYIGRSSSCSFKDPSCRRRLCSVHVDEASTHEGQRGRRGTGRGRRTDFCLLVFNVEWMHHEDALWEENRILWLIRMVSHPPNDDPENWGARTD